MLLCCMKLVTRRKCRYKIFLLATDIISRKNLTRINVLEKSFYANLYFTFARNYFTAKIYTLMVGVAERTRCTVHRTHGVASRWHMLPKYISAVERYHVSHEISIIGDRFLMRNTALDNFSHCFPLHD